MFRRHSSPPVAAHAQTMKNLPLQVQLLRPWPNRDPNVHPKLPEQIEIWMFVTSDNDFPTETAEAQPNQYLR